MEQTNVQMNKKTPFSIKAVKTNKNGYSNRFCVECRIGDYSFRYDKLVVTAWPQSEKGKKARECKAEIESISS